MTTSFFSKFFLSFKVIKNIHVFILDYLGLVKKKEVIYETREDLRFITRQGSSDKGEIVIICGDGEYPRRFFPKGQGPVIVDIGAHIGSFSAYVSRTLEQAQPRVFAVEPFRGNFSQLERNMKLNNLSTRCINAAVGEADGYGAIESGGDFDGLTVKEAPSQEAETADSQKCRIVTLETLFAENTIPVVDLLKMDCEGAEHKIFRKSLPFIKSHVRSLFVEVHEIPGERSVADFKQYLVDNNFSVEAEICGRTYFARNLNL